MGLKDIAELAPMKSVRVVAAEKAGFREDNDVAINQVLRLRVMSKRACVLPTSLPPRGLSRVQAAEYIGVSPTKFDEMVEDRSMPKPKRIGCRVIWDRIKLDEEFEALPGDEDLNPWDEILK